MRLNILKLTIFNTDLSLRTDAQGNGNHKTEVNHKLKNLMTLWFTSVEKHWWIQRGMHIFPISCFSRGTDGSYTPHGTGTMTGARNGIGSRKKGEEPIYAEPISLQSRSQSLSLCNVYPSISVRILGPPPCPGSVQFV